MPILLSLKSRSRRTQRELAGALGIEGLTLTHHLAGLAREKLVTQTGDPDNLRVQRVELTRPASRLHRPRRAERAEPQVAAALRDEHHRFRVKTGLRRSRELI